MRLEGKRALGSFRCRWEDNIKMDLQGSMIGGAQTDCSGT